MRFKLLKMNIKKINLLVLNKINYILSTLYRSFKVDRLLRIKTDYIDIAYLWNVCGMNQAGREKIQNSSKYILMGKTLSIDNLQWNKDYISNVEFDKKRFDKIRLKRYNNVNADVNFSWKLSCCHFVLIDAINYKISGEKKYYYQFKSTLLSWIENNKFLYGVNWFCGMEVAIRAVNWIVAANSFSKEISNDHNFQKILSKTYIQHAEYISNFPEVSQNGYNNNHATSSFTGLLFLAVTLKQHPNHIKWVKQATDGLQSCMNYQTYQDGVNFEGSIYYHRLVMELFAYSTMLCIYHNIKLKDDFIISLFKMFEFTSAYLDHKGNAPQVGDNDSARLLIFEKNIESDHAYLLTLGEHIFDYDFTSCCIKRNPITKSFLPEIKKLEISNFNIIPKKIVPNVQFKNGGATILSNNRFHAFISYFPIGQNGKGGHNHIDTGSFTLSVDGEQIIGDPGSYSYNRDKKERDNFRSAEMHNTMIYKGEKFDLSKTPTFKLTENLNILSNKLSSKKNKLEIKIESKNQKLIRKREFSLQEQSFVVDNYGSHEKEYLCYIILHPNCKIITLNNEVIINEKIKLYFKNIMNIEIDEINYSTSYNVIQVTKRITIKGVGHTSMVFSTINNN